MQVDQIHRGLDNVDDFLRGKTQDQPAAGITLQKEKERFLLKAEELRAASAEVPASALYKESVAAFEEV